MCSHSLEKIRLKRTLVDFMPNGLKIFFSIYREKDEPVTFSTAYPASANAKLSYV